MGIKEIYFGIATLLLGIGGGGVLAYLGQTIWALIVSIVFIAFGIIVLIIGFRKRDKQKLIQERGKDISTIPDTLVLIRQRVDSARSLLMKKKIGQKLFQEIGRDSKDISPINDKTLNGILKHLNNPNDGNKWLHEVKVANNVAVGRTFGERYEALICNIGGLLDSKNVGLISVLDNDEEYSKLKNVLQKQSVKVPNSIKRNIIRYERYLYGVNSVIVYNNYRKRFGIKSLPVLGEVLAVQYGNSSEDLLLNQIMNEINKSIDDYLK